MFKPRLRSQEQEPNTWGANGISSVARDVKYALRTYRRSPGVVVAIVLTLLLGLGANVVAFAVFNWAVLSQPHVADPEHLVGISLVSGGQRYARNVLWYGEYRILRDNNNVLTDLAASSYTEVISSSSASAPLRGLLVSGNYFAALGGRAMLGRTLETTDDLSSGSSAVVMLSHKAWQGIFHGDKNIVGTTIDLGGASFTIIGVADPAFTGLEASGPAFWAPLMMYTVLTPGQGPPEERYEFQLNVVGRLPQQVPRKQAQDATSELVRHLFNSKRNVIGAVLTVGTRGLLSTRQALSIIPPVGLAFGFVLVIACANVTSLLLARSGSRQQEVNIRLSLGAKRWRIIRQFLTENAFLALAAGSLSLGAAYLALRLIGATFSIGMDHPMRLDGTVVLFAALLSLVTGLCFGLPPALELTRGDGLPLRRGDSLLSDRGRRRMRGRNRLVIVQIAFCVVLLFGANLLLRSALKLETVRFDPGFDAEHVIDIRVVEGVTGRYDPNTRPLLAELLRRIPLVKAVSLAPQDQLTARLTTVVAKGSIDPATMAYFRVSPDYFHTLGMSALLGRYFSEAEVENEAPVVMVSQAAAALLWPGQNPIGKALDLRAPPYTIPSVYLPRTGAVEVIGVVKNVAHGIPRSGGDSTPCLYLPVRPSNPINTFLMARVQGEPSHAMEVIRAEFAAVDKDSMLRMRTLSEMLDSQWLASKWMARIALGLGLLALVLTTVGLYGLVSYSVTQRTKEIGVRVALGASTGNVVYLVMRQGVRVTCIGLVAGLVLSAASSRLLSAVLYGVSPFDLFAFIGVPAFLAVVTSTAAFVPAWRASRLDPVVAIRDL